MAEKTVKNIFHIMDFSYVIIYNNRVRGSAKFIKALLLAGLCAFIL